MQTGRGVSWLRGGALGGLVVATAAACGTHASPPVLQEIETRTFANGGFETGALGASPPSWTVNPFLNSFTSVPYDGVDLQTPQTYAGLNLETGGSAGLTTIVGSMAAGPESQVDPNLGLGASLRYPKYGNQCARVNFGSDNGDGHGQNVNELTQTMTVAMGDIDPSDSLVHIRFVVAPVLENPGHPPSEQPYFYIQAINHTQGNAILYENFNFSNQTGVPWKSNAAATIQYTDWQLVDIASTGGTTPSIAINDSVELDIIAAGCEPGGHYGYIYVDGIGSTIPGLFVSGTGPAQANAGTNITYTLTYENGGATPQVGVTVTFNVPPGTEFESYSAPAGVTCTAPAVGSAGGTVTCTVSGTLAASASGSIQITVNVDSTPTTGVVTAGNYYVDSTTTPEPLLGPVINTTIGCTADDQCSTGKWCDISQGDCTATLASGTPMPTDSGHSGTVTPTLDGMCTSAAAMLVCTAQVCDTNNECGYENGDGTCTPGSTAPVCQSGVCDPDMKCGYANGDGSCAPGINVAVCRSGVCDTDDKCGYADGDGPCTAADPSVCRSGDCSADGKCQATGQCQEDKDCPSADWCNETSHTCVAKIANGQAVPTDSNHAMPTLDGKCIAGVGAAVCVSGVCDPQNNECGYANSDGPCSADDGGLPADAAPLPDAGVTGGALCQSGYCGSNGFCAATGTCDVDSDCHAGQWCDESTHVCEAQLANGQPIPTDAPHMNPTLNGQCNVGAGALVCMSGVCDSKDNECGYANGDGPCGGDAGGGAVCQSGICATTGANSGLCVGCLMNSDCPSATPTCDTTTDTCVQCMSSTTCPSEHPICNTSTSTCGACSGDFGSGATGACPTMTDPYCFTSGMAQGSCGLCTTDPQCVGHPGGGICDTTSGACTTTCSTDADCTSSQWCNAAPGGRGMCAAKLPNGTNLPATPTSVSTCTTEVGARVCISGVCDTKNNQCGLAPGDGVCTTNADCDNGTCDTSSQTCAGSAKDAGTADSGAKVATGGSCTTDTQCQSGLCVAGVCNTVVTSGSGVFCSVRVPGGSDESEGVSVLGCALALVGARFRRQRKRGTSGASA